MKSCEITPEEVREFAENCGWSYEPSEWDGFQYTQSAWVSPHKLWSTDLPDLPSDLAACFEAATHFVKSDPEGILMCEVGYAVQRKQFFADVDCGLREFWFYHDTNPCIPLIQAVNAAARARSKAL